MKILIVDDDRAALYALSEVLSDLPAQLVLVQSGEEALRQLLKDEFALVLLDVRLPKMDGFEVAAAIRSLERSRRMPIIFMSANEDRRKQPRGAPGEHAGGEYVAREYYFRKPLIPELVRAKVLALLPPLPHAVDLQHPAAQDRA
jgi:CheY-like chemotaxis protein